MKKERPILMCGEMVRATLDGRKTQTRRVAKLDPRMMEGEAADWCPYGRPGDLLWVKETFYTWDGVGSFAKFKTGRVWYRADGLKTFKWKPSIFMPRWASRITLEIVSVRVERLQDITESDAKAEGVEPHTPSVIDDRIYRRPFNVLWDSINAKTQPWASNPWVWVIEFNKLNRI